MFFKPLHAKEALQRARVHLRRVHETHVIGDQPQHLIDGIVWKAQA